MKLSQYFCYFLFLSLTSRYFLLRFAFECPQATFFPYGLRQSCTPFETRGKVKIFSFIYSDLKLYIFRNLFEIFNISSHSSGCQTMAVTWVRSRVASCNICGGGSGTGTSFSLSLFGFPLLIPIQPYPIHIHQSPLRGAIVLTTQHTITSLFFKLRASTLSLSPGTGFKVRR